LRSLPFWGWVMASKLKTTLVLTVIGLFSSLSIWGVNELTKDIIAQNQAAAELAIYQELYENVAYIVEEPSDDSIVETIIRIYTSSDTQIGTVLRGKSNGYNGEMTVLVAVDMNAKIIQVVVGDNQETPNILGRLVSNHLSNFENLLLRDVTVDVFAGATAVDSYTAIMNVVNASRNLISGDPFLELIAELEIDADGYQSSALILPVSEMFVLTNDSNEVANAFTFDNNEETITIFYEGTTLLGVSGTDVLDDLIGEDVLTETSEDPLALKIIQWIKDIDATKDYDGDFIFASRPYVKEGVVVGTSYLGTSLGFRNDDNTFVVSFLENGSLDFIEQLILSDTRSYYDNYISSSFDELYGTTDFSELNPEDAFAGATSTGASLGDILKEASSLIGENNE